MIFSILVTHAIPNEDNIQQRFERQKTVKFAYIFFCL